MLSHLRALRAFSIFSITLHPYIQIQIDDDTRIWRTVLNNISKLIMFYHVFRQIVSSKRCIVTMVAFVRLFSTVSFQMCLFSTVSSKRLHSRMHCHIQTDRVLPRWETWAINQWTVAKLSESQIKWKSKMRKGSWKDMDVAQTAISWDWKLTFGQEACQRLDPP